MNISSAVPMVSGIPMKNILLFVTDDHGAWAAGCYGNCELQTPNLDRLAADGVRFANAFTPCPVCSPARACLMTGRTPSQVGLHDWLEEGDPRIARRDWLVEEQTLPELLCDCGYHAGLSGKWHLGRSHQTPRGFQWCFGLPGSQGTHNAEYTYHLNGERLRLRGNKSRHITDYALEFLRGAPHDRPFFLNVGYIATHSPYESSAHDPELVALYRAALFSDLPAYHPHPWREDEGRFPESPQPEDIISRRRGYYAAVTEIDRNLGRILEFLERTGRLENTLVVYTSDHGCCLGHHGIWGKGNSTAPLNMYETSLRIPLLMCGPGLMKGQVVAHAVDHYDTFLTLCLWAKVRLPARIRAARRYPGRSYAALAAGASLASWDDTRYGEYGDLRMIRTPKAKFVKRYPAGPYDLFDLRQDPGETLNRAGWSSYAAVQRALEKRLEKWYARHEVSEKSGLQVKQLPRHNRSAEAWRNGRRECRGLQVYPLPGGTPR